MTKRAPITELYHETIEWPPQCVNCGVRPAAATVRLRGRYAFSGSLDVPYCGVCAEARRELPRRTARYVLLGLVPIIIAAPFALSFAYMHRDDPTALPLVLGMSVAVVVWLALAMTALAVSLRHESKRLQQVAVLSPIVVYRTFDAPLGETPRYRLRILNDAVRDFVVSHNAPRQQS
jgi:hypothetical protein